MSDHGYIMAGPSATADQDWLSALESERDPSTFARMTELGVGPAWRCLEVGAGGGSVARWLAGVVGPAGRVVATDVETAVLDALDLPDVEVRRHDVVSDDIEEAAFDLVHARSLLMHLSDPRRALERMVAALAPGGRLFVEDADLGYFVGANDHPDAGAFDTAARRAFASICATGLMDPYFGRRLVASVAGLGLADVGWDAKVRRQRGGDATARFWLGSLEVVRDRLVGDGVIDARAFEAFRVLLADPDFEFVAGIAYSAWGRRVPGA